MRRFGATLLVALTACGRLGFEPLGGDENGTQGTRLVLGDDHGCLLRDSRLICWGQNDFGQLGLGNQSHVSVPFDIGFSARDAGLGQNHTCAIDLDDRLWCWGTNGNGELGCGPDCGIGVPAAVSLPRQAPDTRRYRRISGNNFHTCAIATDDAGLYCWGRNESGQLGVGDKTARAAPTRVVSAGLDRWSTVTAGVSHVCGLQEDDSLWCWGSDGGGALGLGAGTGDRLTPQRVIAGVEPGGIGLGNDTTCAIRGPDLLCWGEGSEYLNGFPDGLDRDLPERLRDAPARLELADEHGCLLERSGSIACWGSNDVGQLGTGDRTGPRPVSQELAGPWSMVAAGNRFSCALDPDSRVWCWGINQTGQLGDGTDITRDVPVLVQLPSM